MTVSDLWNVVGVRDEKYLGHYWSAPMNGTRRLISKFFQSFETSVHTAV